MSTVSWQRDPGTGELIAYDDPFKAITSTEAETAAQAEAEIVAIKVEIEANFLRLAYLLDQFDQQKLYLGRGYETMKAWAESPEIELSWRVVQDLLRIVREAVPVLSAIYAVSAGDGAATAHANRSILRAGISKTRAALPLLNDDSKRTDFIEVIELAPEMPWNDVRKEVKERRGLLNPLGTPEAVRFYAHVTLSATSAKVQLSASDGTTIETLGTLYLRRSWLAPFEDRFGTFISFDTTSDARPIS